jgi:hypothetical protein
MEANSIFRHNLYDYGESYRHGSFNIQKMWFMFLRQATLTIWCSIGKPFHMPRKEGKKQTWRKNISSSLIALYVSNDAWISGIWTLYLFMPNCRLRVQFLFFAEVVSIFIWILKCRPFKVFHFSFPNATIERPYEYADDTAFVSTEIITELVCSTIKLQETNLIVL